MKDPKDVVSIAISDGWASCGQRAYTLLEGANVPAFATITQVTATNDFKIVVKNDLEALIGTHAMTLTV